MRLFVVLNLLCETRDSHKKKKKHRSSQQTPPMDKDNERLLDLVSSAQDPKHLSPSMSASFLSYVRQQGSLLNSDSRCKVLLSLMYGNAETEEAKALLTACEEDSDDWVRLVAAVVSKRMTGGGGGAFDRAARDCATLLANTKPAGYKQLCPSVLPRFLAMCDPEVLDVDVRTRLGMNVHFSKKVKVDIVGQGPKAAVQKSASGIPKPGDIPVNAQALLDEATVLSQADRDTIRGFLINPLTSALKTVTQFELFKKVATDETGKTTVITTYIQLDPVARLWKPVKKMASAKLTSSPSPMPPSLMSPPPATS